LKPSTRRSPQCLDVPFPFVACTNLNKILHGSVSLTLTSFWQSDEANEVNKIEEMRHQSFSRPQDMKICKNIYSDSSRSHTLLSMFGIAKWKFNQLEN
jgi:hypothetical protein